MSNWIYTYEQFYRRGGWLPNGNPGMKYFRVMIGNPALPLIVSGYQHGIRDFDSQLMYRALIHQQTATMINYPGGGQVGNESYPDYITKGYVPLYDDAWIGILRIINHTFPIQWNTHIKTIALLNILTLLIKKMTSIHL